MMCPKCNSEDTAIVSYITRRWSEMIFRARRVGGDDVEREQVDKSRCLDCGHEWEGVMPKYEFDAGRWCESMTIAHYRRKDFTTAENFNQTRLEIERLRDELAALKAAAGLVAEWYKQWGYAFIEERKKVFDALARLCGEG